MGWGSIGQRMTIVGGGSEASTPPVSGGGGGGCPTFIAYGNIYDYAFNDGGGTPGSQGKFQNFSGGSYLSQSGTNGTTLTITTADSVLNGAQCMEIGYVIAGVDQGCSILFQTSFNGGPTVHDFYVRWAMKHSGSPNTAQKLLRFRDSGIGLASSFIGNLNGGGDFSWISDGNPSFSNNQPIPGTPLISAILNQWHWWEIHYKSDAVTNSHVTIWYDNTQVLDRDLGAVASTAATGFSLDGTCNAGLSSAFTTRFDQVGVSTSRMGIPCTETSP